jgi:hypothetical protein
LIGIIKYKNIICSNSQYNVNNHNLHKSKVFDLENSIGDDNCEWETKDNDSNSKATQKA